MWFPAERTDLTLSCTAVAWSGDHKSNPSFPPTASPPLAGGSKSARCHIES